MPKLKKGSQCNMFYHNITKDEMLNGDGLGVVLWVAGCSHRCSSCQNPETWSTTSGIEFDESARREIFEQLDKDYISRLTLSGGDPLHKNNIDTLTELVKEVRNKYGHTKKIWLYSGYTYENLLEDKDEDEVSNKRFNLMSTCDVFVDGRFYKNLADEKYHWAGSINQKIINVPESLKQNKIVLYCD